jgi:hypothetical protein
MSAGELFLQAQELLGQLREEPRSAEEKERLLAAMDALRFILATGQLHDLEAYRKSLDEQAPPLVIATFDSREDADAWLKNHPNPPHQAYVLIRGEYHVVMNVPELQHRRLISHPVLEFYLAEKARDGIPSPVASFSTMDEARAWLDAQPEPPRQVFIQIAGENYLAAYHHRVDVRALYPLRESQAQPSGDAS